MDSNLLLGCFSALFAIVGTCGIGIWMVVSIGNIGKDKKNKAQ